MAIAGLGQRDIAAFVRKVRNVQNTIPDAARDGAFKAGMEVKAAWLGVARTRAGITPANKIARRKWNVGFDVKGGANATTLVEFRGPVHFVFGATKQHFIGAKLLGTRNSLRSKSKRVGIGAAFGERSSTGLVRANRGQFGTIQRYVNYSRYGSTRKSMETGQLRERAGAQALKIGSNLRAYAFHPGTSGEPTVWPEAKRLAVEIGPKVYKAEYQKALAKAGLGAGKDILGAVR